MPALPPRLPFLPASAKTRPDQASNPTHATVLKRLRRLLSDDDPADRAARFWRWFAANEAVYRGLQTQPEAEVAHSLSVLANHLAEYGEGLEPLFGFDAASGRHEFIVSAGGMREGFPAARALVAAAPELPGWHVIALKPPHPSPIAITLEGRSFDPAAVQFAVVTYPDEPEAFAIRVFHAPYPPAEQDLHQMATFLLLDMLLGERAVAEDVRYISTAPLSDEVPANVLRPLTALPGVVKAR